MSNKKSSMKDTGAGPSQKKAGTTGLRVRTAVKAGKVSFQDFHFTS